MRHFNDLRDFSVEEINQLLDIAFMLKKADKRGACPQLLKDRSLGMIFAESSTRTRVSFEVAMTKLGGHAVYMKPGEIHLGKAETVKDSALVLSRFLDVIMARVHGHDEILELAEHATVPVINGMTEYLHPCQALCDLMTMVEFMPAGKELKDAKMAFIGDCTDYENVGTALSHLLPRFGAELIYGSPKEYTGDDAFYEPARKACEEGGGKFSIVEDAKEAVKDADFIYASVMWYAGYDENEQRRRDIFMPNYQITEELASLASPEAKFMHYLPALRGYEMTDGIMDHERSVLWDQAENRMYSEMAILVYLLYPSIKLNTASEAQKAVHKAKIEDYLEEILL